MDANQLKQAAAEKAVSFVESGMVVGLGVGSTAIFAVRKIGAMIRVGELKDIVGIACSLSVEEEATKAGIPLTDLGQNPIIDLTIDGADEVDPDLNLIKGGGGALFREKIVAQASKREIIIVDENKLSPALGTNWPLPIEVNPFGWETHIDFLKTLGGEPNLRINEDGTTYITDQNNYIIDCDFGPIDNPTNLSNTLNNRVGIVEHGLFLGLATDVIVARPGKIEHLIK